MSGEGVYNDIEPMEDESFFDKVVGFLARLFIKPFKDRAYIIKKHWLNPKKWLRRAGLSSTVALGAISFFCGIVSVVFNKDFDPVDKFFSKLLKKIGLGILAEDLEEENSSRKGRRQSDESSGIGGKAIMVAGVAVLGVAFLAIVPGFVGGTPIGDWAEFGGTQLQDRVLVPMDLDPQFAVLQQGYARISCMAQGPDCYQEWQMNNTQRPDSNNVGQQFGLSIDSFEVGQGGSVDVAYNEPDREVPVSFTISNTRRGLDGVPAYDVNYRLKMFDSRGDYCDTDWEPINGYDLESKADNQRHPGEDNDLFPGGSVSVFESLEGFTLGDCEMIQAGLGDYRTVALELEYDYSSLADIQVEAMSRQTLQADETVTIGEKNSQTADTPAKAALQVNEPVLFDENRLTGDSIDLAPQPFALRATVNTDEFDIEYKVNDLEITKSQFIERAVDEDASSCQFEFDGDLLTVDDRVIDNIIDTGNNDRNPGYYWFDANRNPPIIGCPMQLDPDMLDQISSTGTTLETSIDANYTVRLEENMENFEISNSVCGTEPCPMLVTQEFADQDNSGIDWQTECSGAAGSGASRGCSVMKGEEFGDNYQRIDLGEFIASNPLRENERAIDPVSSDLINNNGQLNSEWFDNYERIEQAPDNLAIGLGENDRRYIRQNDGWAITAQDSGILNTLSEDDCDMTGSEIIAYDSPEGCQVL